MASPFECPDCGRPLLYLVHGDELVADCNVCGHSWRRRQQPDPEQAGSAPRCDRCGRPVPYSGRGRPLSRHPDCALVRRYA